MAKILIAEDDSFLANAYRVKFEKEGWQVVIVGNGAEAVAEAKKYKPDVILLDLVMPKMDGFEALKLLKADKITAKIRVVVASNLGQDSDMIRARELGADDYLIKSDTPISAVVAKVSK